MKTTDIPNCPYFTPVGTNPEEDGFIQYDPVKGIVMMLLVHGREEPVNCVQRTYEDGDWGTGVLFTLGDADDGDYHEVLDGEEFTLRIYTCQRVL